MLPARIMKLLEFVGFSGNRVRFNKKSSLYFLHNIITQIWVRLSYTKSDLNFKCIFCNDAHDIVIGQLKSPGKSFHEFSLNLLFSFFI